MSHTPSPYWGRDQAAFLADLRDTLVTVTFADGKGLKGALVDADPYNVFVQVKLNGTLTGEHGIGVTKREYLSWQLEPRELEITAGLKALFDPQNILNPGKIIARER